VFLLAHVLLQHGMIFEGFSTVNALQIVDLRLEIIQQLVEIDEIVGPPDVEVVFGKHVRKDDVSPTKDFGTKQAFPLESGVRALLLLS